MTSKIQKVQYQNQYSNWCSSQEYHIELLYELIPFVILKEIVESCKYVDEMQTEYQGSNYC